MRGKLRIRRIIGVALLMIATVLFVMQQPASYTPVPKNQNEPVTAPSDTRTTASDETGDSAVHSEAVPARAIDALETLAVKGRAPKTDYARSQFGDGWARQGECDMRNVILNRDLKDAIVDSNCKVQSGVLDDPYTAQQVEFIRGPSTSDDVQIDHVVALSDAWQKGAQQLTLAERTALANDPVELLAVDGAANQAKAASDAASWLPPNKAFRCQYVSRQIAVKQKYRLWVTDAEKQAMAQVLGNCPDQLLPIK